MKDQLLMVAKWLQQQRTYFEKRIDNLSKISDQRKQEQDGQNKKMINQAHDYYTYCQKDIRKLQADLNMAIATNKAQDYRLKKLEAKRR